MIVKPQEIARLYNTLNKQPALFCEVLGIPMTMIPFHFDDYFVRTMIRCYEGGYTGARWDMLLEFGTSWDSRDDVEPIILDEVSPYNYISRKHPMTEVVLKTYSISTPPNNTTSGVELWMKDWTLLRMFGDEPWPITHNQTVIDLLTKDLSEG